MLKWIHQQNFMIVLLLFVVILNACRQMDGPIAEATISLIPEENLETAIFAGGCFWCTESDFDKIQGVVSTTSGYIGGTVENPTYGQVVAGKTGHVEAVKIHFDNTKTSFSQLLAAYWITIDPLTINKQFCDVGPQYRSVIFYRNSDQKELAETSKKELAASRRFNRPIVTEILPATEFYRAEEYHQDYYIKNPLRYTYYRNNCGRDKRLEELWGIKH
ncbi:peptide-methionine (S)-S-oxide reductase MsrA [Nitrosomonas sp.]|uniref:peptide-methionine (S)-S-oxide reductase MsrA n=1 Tax=Nitrosomonas sp. TaxID=42353 RepID=UPI0025F36A6B|nr:peptide-methionine (S)-S-oxide reductase MsrA [Nitrosomonas sp.]MBY0484407.1 peptide-methionine (S)-S-oxide reductase MsrA [Nitrosomonas sp.]